MKKISRFDLGMIIAFVVVAILGGAGWWYLSGQLATAQAAASTAGSDFDTYTKKEVYLPTESNIKTLQANIDTMTAQLDPIVKDKLQSPKSALANMNTVTTVEWKHNLDDEVGKLNDAAKVHGIIVPKNFYFGFSRYLNTNPAEDATPVLERQELAIGEVANILIGAPVREIVAVRRTYEEDPDTEGRGNRPAATTTSSDQLAGHSVEAPGGVYTSYPFEFEFTVKDMAAFRKVVNDLTASNYVFVIRSVMVQNQRLDSPKERDLDTIANAANSAAGAGSGPASNATPVGSGAPATNAPPPALGLRYLFGDETVHIRARIDLVDWHGLAHATAASDNGGRGGREGGGGGGGRNRNRNQPGAGGNGV
jgi:hypothetical protein